MERRFIYHTVLEAGSQEHGAFLCEGLVLRQSVAEGLMGDSKRLVRSCLLFA